MAGGNRGRQTDASPTTPPDDEDDLSARLKRLDSALDKQRPADGTGKKGNAAGSASYAQAMRMSTDFIAGVVVGGGLGWLIDKVLGISPWGLIVFLMLGFAAGVLNVLRSAGLVTEAPHAKARDDKEE